MHGNHPTEQTMQSQPSASPTGAALHHSGEENNMSYATELRAIIAEKNWSGETFIQTSDQRGDGYDIACAPHKDEYDEIVAQLRPLGVTVSKMYANGYLCGYIIRRAEPGKETIRNCQHSGNWGPWYHYSLYRRQPSGAWKFVRSWGHSKRRDANYLYGRPLKHEER